jgi:hypothetical protein
MVESKLTDPKATKAVNSEGGDEVTADSEIPHGHHNHGITAPDNPCRPKATEVGSSKNLSCAQTFSAEPVLEQLLFLA